MRIWQKIEGLIALVKNITVDERNKILEMMKKRMIMEL